MATSIKSYLNLMPDALASSIQSHLNSKPDQKNKFSELHKKHSTNFKFCELQFLLPTTT